MTLYLGDPGAGIPGSKKYDFLYLGLLHLAGVDIVDVVIDKDASIKVALQNETRNTGEKEFWKEKNTRRKFWKRKRKEKNTSRKPHQSPTQQHTPVSGCKKDVNILKGPIHEGSPSVTF